MQGASSTVFTAAQAGIEAFSGALIDFNTTVCVLNNRVALPFRIILEWEKHALWTVIDLRCACLPAGVVVGQHDCLVRLCVHPVSVLSDLHRAMI